MWSYLTSVFHYFFNKEEENREQLLVEELIDIKLQLESEEYYNQNKEHDVQTIPKQSECFQRTGNIICSH